MQELDLIEGCIRKDARCQRLLYERFAPKMLSVCIRYARERSEAEDILQDAFVKVFNNLEKFEHRGSFEGWIRRIMVNTALKYYRKLRFQMEQSGLDYSNDEPVMPTAETELSAQDLISIISGLPDGYRVVFNMYAIEGFSHREIAEALDIKESTSRSQLVKARKMLQGLVTERQKVRL